VNVLVLGANGQLARHTIPSSCGTRVQDSYRPNVLAAAVIALAALVQPA
jgi:hypothetical protein